MSAADFSRRRTPADLPLILPHLQGTATGGGVAVIRLEYETETGGPIHTEILGT